MIVKKIYISFEHGRVGIVLGDNSIVELINHCEAIVLNGTSPTNSYQL